MPDKETVPDAVIRDFVVRSGLVQGDPSPHFTALTGGVASDIWKVETREQTFVVKKALSRLRVAREWTAPVSRNASEVDWLVTAGAVVPDAVPKVLAHDEQAGAFAMEFLDPAEYPVWKAELRAGNAIPAFAAQVGKALAAIHNATAGDEMVARRFANDAVFHAIRLEPYLEATALVHPRPVGRTHGAVARHARDQAGAGAWRRKSQEHPGRPASARCSSMPSAHGTAIRPSTSPSVSTICF